MEDSSFSYEIPFSPGFFNITNPTLADLSNDINGHAAAMFPADSSNNNGSNSLLADLSINNIAALPQQQNHQGGVFQQRHDSNQDSFLDPIIQNHRQNVINTFSFGGNVNFEAGGPSSQMDMNQRQTANGFPVSQNNNFDIHALEYWPPTPAQFFCSCCQVLREIIHTNGTVFEKLEIHGRLGSISHAVHHQKNINGDASMCQMIDFCRRSLGEIKDFLGTYCIERSLSGFFILQDPMSAYYETICTGLDWIDDINMEDNNQNNSDDMVEQVVENGKKVNLAEQRYRAGKMTVSDLADYFHLPIEEASKIIELCPTVLKKICRKASLARWPHRKVKSILKQITLLASTLNSGDAASRARSEAEIARLKQEMILHCGGVVPIALYNIPM